MLIKWRLVFANGSSYSIEVPESKIGASVRNRSVSRSLKIPKFSQCPSVFVIRKFVKIIRKIPAAARLAGSATIEMQYVLRVSCKPKLLVDHGGECLIDILEPVSF